jgi:glycosyltransferase involved in cell wall biosynthesis
MADLSVLIPARNEMFLARTIEDVLANARGNTEVIAVLDGAWADPPIADHPRVVLIHRPEAIGQRAATNLAARLSTATYVMKLDAHCSVDEGFDLKLIAADEELGRPDVTQIPAQYNHHAFNWRCRACGRETYQGPTPVKCGDRKDEELDVPKPPCGKSDGFDRVMVWKPRHRKAAGNGSEGRGHLVRTEFWRFDQHLHFQYWDSYRERAAAKGEIADVMSSLGACFFMRRDRFFELGGLDEAHGSWGQFGTEIACKSWLSGGRHVVNKRTWFSHLFRTQGGDFGFPYPQPNAAVDRARQHSRTAVDRRHLAGREVPAAVAARQVRAGAGLAVSDGSSSSGLLPGGKTRKLPPRFGATTSRSAQSPGATTQNGPAM